ncbi:MAG: hypothetical protein AAGL49_08690, partial [Pseudomonadota bacterium]
MLGVLVIGVGAAAATAGLYWAWRRRVIAELDAGAEFDWGFLQKTDPELLDGLDFDGFRAIHRRANFPTGPGYALATLVAVAAGTPLLLGVLSGIAAAAEALGLTPDFPQLIGALQVDEGVLRYL